MFCSTVTSSWLICLTTRFSLKYDNNVSSMYVAVGQMSAKFMPYLARASKRTKDWIVKFYAHNLIKTFQLEVYLWLMCPVIISKFTENQFYKICRNGGTARMSFNLFTVSGDDLETFVIRHIIAALQQPVSHTNQAFITTKWLHRWYAHGLC